VITVGGFNTAVDKTLDADELALGALNRVRGVRAAPGGKGLHVALTVAALGERVRLVGLMDAVHRAEFEDALGARGVEFHGVEATGQIRTCLVIRDRGGARITEVLEPGPLMTADERARLEARFLALASESDLAVLSGSAPRGFDDATYARLVTSLSEAGVRCLVDASGGLLRRAVEARPFLIKPNREEAEALTGASIVEPAAAGGVARALSERGVGIVVVSLGAVGAVAARGPRAVHATVPVTDVLNPVGSGDCLLGGVAVALTRGDALDEMLRLGVACGSANAVVGDRGWLQRADVERALPRVTVAEI
jgi:1-phosphofructokinase family hexose kinase